MQIDISYDLQLYLKRLLCAQEKFRMVKKRYSLIVYSERCKDCGICIAFCPKNNLRPGENGAPEFIDPEACSGCKLCEYLCPDFAIQIKENENNKE